MNWVNANIVDKYNADIKKGRIDSSDIIVIHKTSGNLENLLIVKLTKPGSLQLPHPAQLTNSLVRSLKVS